MKRTGTKLLSVILSLLLLAALIPAAALAADDHSHTGWTKWTFSDKLPTAAGNYVLTCNVAVAQSWLVPKGEVKLCLEGHSIILSGDSGPVIQIPDGATLELYDQENNNGMITGGRGNDNAAVYLGGGVSVKGTFTMYGGTISGNSASNGGGVYIDTTGTFNMNGGKISGNTAAVNGGGIYTANRLYVSGSATVTSNTCRGSANNIHLPIDKIIRVSGPLTGTLGVNTADEPTQKEPLTLTSSLREKGGAQNFVSDISRYFVTVNSLGEAILKIFDRSELRFPTWESSVSLPNKAGSYSLTGNVTLQETWIVPQGTTKLCLEGRTVRYAGETGSAIEVPKGATLELYDMDGNAGVITGGKGLDVSGNLLGGGVYVNGIFSLYGGTISGNRASNGGGVYADTDGTVRLLGGVISGNTASVSGGGVFVKGTLAVAGSATVTGNTLDSAADNIRLAQDKRITVVGALSGKLGVSTTTLPAADKPLVISSGLKGNGSTANFSSDDSRCVLGVNTDAEVVLSLSEKAPSQDPSKPSEDPTKPSQDPSKPSQDPVKPADLKFTAWTGTETLPDKPGDYSLSGNVTLKQTWTVPQGTTRLSLEGHSLALNAESGSVIQVPAGATLELYDAAGASGVVTGGKGAAGSGFYLGGGVYVKGSFTMFGGTISGNSATSGGGIYVDTDAVCRLAGGKVTGNTATVNGAGVFARSTFELSGNATVTGNKKGASADNIRLAAEKVITITDKYTGTAGINTAAVPTDKAPTLITAGLSGKGTAANFSSDDASYQIALNQAGEAILILPAAPAKEIVYIDWTNGKALPAAAGDFKLTCDVLLPESWTAPKGTTRLHLNGHSIALSAASGSVLQIPGDAAVELFDLENDTGVITKGKGHADASGSFGGGVYVRGLLIQHGGRIMGNSATSGGGVYVDSDGTFRMLGGKITGNTVTGFGGGVFVRGGFEVAGAVSVTANAKKEGGADNVRLAANEIINVIGPLSGSVGVNKAAVAEVNNPVALTAGLTGNGTAAIFSSDNKNYTIILDEKGEAWISVFCPKDKTCPIGAFTDADPKGWYHDGVHFVLESGFMHGYGGGLFGPNDATSRAMTATIIWNMAGKPKAEGKLNFIDVKDGEWYTEAIRWAAGAGIITGYTDGISGELIFCPNDNITREQLATMMFRFAKSVGIDVSVGENTNILSYDDAFSIGTWAIDAMQWTAGSGLMGGRTATTLDPKAYATRAEVATVVMRYSTKVAK